MGRALEQFPPLGSFGSGLHVHLMFTTPLYYHHVKQLGHRTMDATRFFFKYEFVFKLNFTTQKKCAKEVFCFIIFAVAQKPDPTTTMDPLYAAVKVIREDRRAEAMTALANASKHARRLFVAVLTPVPEHRPTAGAAALLAHRQKAK